MSENSAKTKGSVQTTVLVFTLEGLKNYCWPLELCDHFVYVSCFSEQRIKVAINFLQP